MKSSLTPETIDSMLKSSLSLSKEDNQASWALSKLLGSRINAEIKLAEAECRKEAVATSSGDTFSDSIKKFVDNPMTPEEEAKGLRAMLHAGIFTGELPSNLLAVLEKTIGVNSGEDDKIEVVDFSTAFPDMAMAKDVSMKMIEEQMK